MKFPRRTLQSTVCIAAIAALRLSTASVILAQETTQEKRVALKTADGKYVSTAASGGLDLSGKSVTDKTTFAVVDSNGGGLDDGDEVKIKYTPGQVSDAGKNKPSFWVEDAGKINRVNQEPTGASGKFVLKKQGEGFVLKTTSGKFAAAPTGEGGLGLADKMESALVLKIEEQGSAK
ncbi:MAG: hypothetical protein QOD99_1768 [Chthoniobacter sp.]|jgi:hypothetical protein|nr:hypothetical protein [Chthoniobacter sp.]